MDSKKVLRKLEHFEEDEDIKAVVLRLNSPGGSVAPSQEIYEAVRSYKKPLVVSMASVAASGAYYIACGAKKVFANPGTITGSIGVIMEFANLQKLYEWAKIQRYVLKTGKFKDAGAGYREMSAEEKALLQGMIDDVLVQFKTAVAEGRQLSMAEVTAVADGRIFSGHQAHAAHLVDELGTLKDAIAEAARMGKIEGKPHVVYLEKSKHRLLDYIIDDGGPSEESQFQGGMPGALIDRLVTLIRGGSPKDSEVSPFSPGIYWIWRGVGSGE